MRGQPRDVQQIDALRIEDREQLLIEIALGLLAGLVADAMRSLLARLHPAITIAVDRADPVTLEHGRKLCLLGQRPVHRCPADLQRFGYG